MQWSPSRRSAGRRAARPRIGGVTMRARHLAFASWARACSSAVPIPVPLRANATWSSSGRCDGPDPSPVAGGAGGSLCGLSEVSAAYRTSRSRGGRAPRFSCRAPRCRRRTPCSRTNGPGPLCGRGRRSHPPTHLLISANHHEVATWRRLTPPDIDICMRANIDVRESPSRLTTKPRTVRRHERSGGTNGHAT